MDHMRKGLRKQCSHGASVQHQGRVIYQKQTRRQEVPREDGEQRAGEGTQAGQQQGEGGEGGGREAFWQAEGLKSYRASQWGQRFV